MRRPQFLLALGLTLGASVTQAQPSLALPTDSAPPFTRMALSVDVLAPIWSEYQVALHAMPTRFVGGRIIGGYRRGDQRAALVRLALDVRPMGRSFDGLLLAVGAALDWGAALRFGGFAEAGYAFIWRGLLVSGAIGARFSSGPDRRRVLAPTARISAGWAF